MSDLQDALDEAVIFSRFTDDGLRWLVNEVIVDAARRAANLDIDKATIVIYQLRYIRDEDEWDDRVGDITEEAVNAALGITENTPKHTLGATMGPYNEFLDEGITEEVKRPGWMTDEPWVEDTE